MAASASMSSVSQKLDAIRHAKETGADTIPIWLPCEKRGCRRVYETNHFCSNCDMMLHPECNVSESAEGLRMMHEHPAAAEAIRGNRFACTLQCLRTQLGLPAEPETTTQDATEDSERASQAVFDNYVSYRVTTHIGNIVLPQHAARDVNRDHVADMKNQLKSVGYRPHGSTITVTLQQEGGGESSQRTSDIQEGSMYGLDAARFVLVDGRHRLTALQELLDDMDTCTQWAPTCERLQVTVWMTTAGLALSSLEVLRLGTHLNDITGLVLGSLVRDYIYAAVSATRTINVRHSTDNETEPRSCTARDLAQRFNRDKSIGNHKSRQCRRYANIAVRLAPSEQAFRSVLQAYDESNGKLGVVHLDNAELLRTDDDNAFHFTLQVLARRLKVTGDGRFESYGHLLFAACDAMFTEITKLARLNDMSINQFLKVEVSFGRSDTTTLEDFAMNKIAKAAFNTDSIEAKVSRQRCKMIRDKVESAGYTIPEATPLNTTPNKSATSSQAKQTPSQTDAQGPLINKRFRVTRRTTRSASKQNELAGEPIPLSPTPIDLDPDITAEERPQSHHTDEITPVRPKRKQGESDRELEMGRLNQPHSSASKRKRDIRQPLRSSRKDAGGGSSTKSNKSTRRRRRRRRKRRKTARTQGSGDESSQSEDGSSSDESSDNGRDNRRSGGAHDHDDEDDASLHVYEDNPLPTEIIPAGDLRFDDFVPSTLPHGYADRPEAVSNNARPGNVKYLFEADISFLWGTYDLWRDTVRGILDECHIPPEHRANVVLTIDDCVAVFTSLAFRAGLQGLLQSPYFSQDGARREGSIWKVNEDARFDLYTMLLLKKTSIATKFWTRKGAEFEHRGYTLLEGFLNDSDIPERMTIYTRKASSSLLRLTGWFQPYQPGDEDDEDLDDEEMDEDARAERDARVRYRHDGTAIPRATFLSSGMRFQDSFKQLYRHWNETFPSDEVLKDPVRSADDSLPYHYIINSSSAADDSAQSRQANGRYMSSRKSLMEDLETVDNVTMCRTRALLDLYVGAAARLMNLGDNAEHPSDATTVYLPNTGGRVLVTKGKCKRQLLHADGHPSTVQQVLAGTDNSGFFAIATFADESPLWVASGSHRNVAVAWCMDNPDALNHLSECSVVEKVIIPPWSIFFARLDTYHAGPGHMDYETYGDMSLRYHMYGLPRGYQLKDGVETIPSFRPAFREHGWYNEDPTVPTGRQHEQEQPQNSSHGGGGSNSGRSDAPDYDEFRPPSDQGSST